MGQPTGQAGVSIDLLDLSVIISNGLQGIAAVHGITERGPTDKAVLVGSLSEYNKHFGSEIPESDFPHIARRALERGGRLLVSRAVHYVDPTDKGSMLGTKASLDLALDCVGVFSITGTAGQIDSIGVTPPATILTSTAVPFNTGIDDTAQDLIDNINDNAGAIIASILSTDTITVQIQITLDSSFDGSTFLLVSTGGITTTQITGMTSPTGVTIEAANIGDWGNGLSVTVTPAKSGAVNEFDVTIDLAGSPQLQQVILNQPAIMTALSIGLFNAEAVLIQIDTTSADDFIGLIATTPLTLGDEDKGLIVDSDFLGDSIAGTGFHQFSDYTNFVRVAVPEKAVPEIDIALAAYAEARTDCRAILRTPTNVSGLVAVDYREGQGSYSHTAINTHYASIIFGALQVIDPLTNNAVNISAIGDYLGASTVKDSKIGAWYSVAGAKRGKISNALGVVYNLSPARKTEADLVDVRGINAVIDDSALGIVIFGNGTLQKANTLLKHENVSDLWVFINRGLAPLVKTELFDPNDFVTWKTVTRKIKPFLEFLKGKRAIWKYLIQGDQDIDKIEDAVVNTPAGIDAGQYKLNLWIAPIVGLKYIGIQAVITNSGVNFEELAGQPTVV